MLQTRRCKTATILQYSKFPTNEPLSCKCAFPQVSVRHKWNCNLPSVSCCGGSFNSTIYHLLSLLQSVTLLACSLDTSFCIPAVVLITVLFKVLYWEIKKVLFSFFVCVCFFYVSFVWKVLWPITIQYYTANRVSWVPRLTLLDIWPNWTYKHPLRMEFICI